MRALTLAPECFAAATPTRDEGAAPATTDVSRDRYGGTPRWISAPSQWPAAQQLDAATTRPIKHRCNGPYQRALGPLHVLDMTCVSQIRYTETTSALWGRASLSDSAQAFSNYNREVSMVSTRRLISDLTRSRFMIGEDGIGDRRRTPRHAVQEDASGCQW